MTRILTRWVTAHPTHGMTPLLAATAFDSTDEQAALLIEGDQLPLTIYNDVDDECVAARYDPDVVPALVIVAELATECTVTYGRGQVDYDGVDVAFSYMERDQPINYSRQRGGYVLTAVMDSLIAFSVPAVSKIPIPGALEVAFADTSENWRALGDVEILEVTAFRESRVNGGIGKSTLIGSLLVTCKVKRRTRSRYLP